MGVYRKHNWQRKMKKTTIKEIKRWLKTLEEFRYRKVRGVDARRIASFVNNGINETDLPQSLIKKWSHAKYGREKHLANKFVRERINTESVNYKDFYNDVLNEKVHRLKSTRTTLPADKNLTVIFHSKTRLSNYKTGDTIKYTDKNNVKVDLKVLSPYEPINLKKLSSDEKNRFRDVMKGVTSQGDPAQSGKSVGYMIKTKKI